MNCGIAIVGMGCRYPDARNPVELWENVLARRRAFRRLPAERMLLDDYFSADPETADAIYSSEAALIEGYEFDRVRFRVAGPMFRSVDMAHWLALDVADQALKDAGVGEARGWPRETTGVLVGNTLTGEFSRAATLRLRWPYVRRVLEARLIAEGWDEKRRLVFLRKMEKDYKAPFAPVGEESLAGALSNTIAGRICNYFHFGGGGYTVDGACCSSLLAVAQACSALLRGELDVCLAGGVDLSLDPFELVGFAKTGALARGEMLVYDRGSSGFLPGEGCGFVVLMRAEEALAQNRRTYAIIRGWGISSDGAGSITRPERRGQMLAIERAYQRAGYGIETVSLFEGHGTGTPVGDEVEIQALLAALKTSEAKAPAAIGSIKANIGHTKAAAGVAGLIKATLAVFHRTLPPATGVLVPRTELTGADGVFRVLEDAELCPGNVPLRAGVNSFGFGGINVHVTIEGGRRERPASLSLHEQALLSCHQDSELFLLDSDHETDLGQAVSALATDAQGFSYSDLSDVANALYRRIGGRKWRAAVVASTPAAMAERLKLLHTLLEGGASHHLDPAHGIFLDTAGSPPRIGLVFPGQASPVRLNGGPHVRRFPFLRELYRELTSLKSHEEKSTYVAQLAIIVAELAGLRLLKTLGIEPCVSIGHSLGELAAYCQAGAIEESALLRLVDLRGRLMGEIPGPAGSMANICAAPVAVQSLIENAEPVVIACFNGSHQTVVAGETSAVARVVSRAQTRGWDATVLSAAHAFHSPLMFPAAALFAEQIATIPFDTPRGRVVSTITGTELAGSDDLRRLLVQQLTAPVRFVEAVQKAHHGTDLFIEVGPGRVLTDLVQRLSELPAIALDIAGPSLTGVLQAAAAAYVKGAAVRLDALFDSRFTRPFTLGKKAHFFVNPCELAPAPNSKQTTPDPIEAEQDGSIGADTAQSLGAQRPAESAAEILRSLVARRTELPPEALHHDARLLRDLHLNSIVVAEIVAAAARILGIAAPGRPLDFADATLGELAQALARLKNTAPSMSSDEIIPAGVDGWVRAFIPKWSPSPLPPRAERVRPAGEWIALGTGSNGSPLLPATSGLPGNGVIVCLSVTPVEEQWRLLLQGAHAILHQGKGQRYFVVAGPGASVCSSFARTLHLEHEEILTRVIEAPLQPELSEYIRQEVASGPGHVLARYDAAAQRCTQKWGLLSEKGPDEVPVGEDDVLVVTGGGMGIVAACASALAQKTGARLVILGRSQPENSVELARRLKEFTAAGLKIKYIATDVSNYDAVKTAVSQAEAAFGRITGIIHGAGCNEPMLVRELDEATVQRTLAPKVLGLRNLLAALPGDQLRLLVTFGSVIGRVGLRGEAHYALANACVASDTEDFADQHPVCRCLVLESTAWSGLGMAERLGTVERLRRDGIATITPEEGVAWFHRLVSTRTPAVAVALTGRLGATCPLAIDAPQLPALRFVERPRVHYPAMELVTECDITTASDPYLLEHAFQHEPLMPGVMGLEAMVQAAMAVTGSQRAPVLTDVRFEQTIVVQPQTRVTLRLAALVRETGAVEVVLRSSQTSFAVDHFRCTCTFSGLPEEGPSVTAPPEAVRLPIEPERDLYGTLLFQSGRFRRLAGYRSLSAGSCWAEIAPAGDQKWFSQYLPETLLLGDAAARDAAVHSVQACVPHATLLPIAVERVIPGRLQPREKLMVHATERWHNSDTYCYDVELRNVDGRLLERWQGLTLRKVADVACENWPDPLVAASLEWRMREMTATAQLSAAFERDSSADRRSRSERAIQKALNSRQPVRWRHDGKPEVELPMWVSAAHSDGLTLAVAAPQLVACDLEPVQMREEQVWRDLLGLESWRVAQLIAKETGEDLQSAATRVWTAMETLKKAGYPEHGQIVVVPGPMEKQGCVSLAAAGVKIASTIVHFRENPIPVAITVLTGAPNALL